MLAVDCFTLLKVIDEDYAITLLADETVFAFSEWVCQSRFIISTDSPIRTVTTAFLNCVSIMLTWVLTLGKIEYVSPVNIFHMLVVILDDIGTWQNAYGSNFVLSTYFTDVWWIMVIRQELNSSVVFPSELPKAGEECENSLCAKLLQ